MLLQGQFGPSSFHHLDALSCVSEVALTRLFRGFGLRGVPGKQRTRGDIVHIYSCFRRFRRVQVATQRTSLVS